MALFTLWHPVRLVSRLHDLLDIDGRQVVIPVVMARPDMTGEALRITPDDATTRTPSLRVEGVPGMAATAFPSIVRAWLPMAFRTIDFIHDANLGISVLAA
jgi:hypothetical protein